jgi:photosystem II stability/assembly factor-like uncharacterized protein
MKFLRKFYIWFLLVFIPLFMGAKHGGCSFLEAIYFTTCSPDPGVQFNSLGGDVGNKSILVCDQGKIFIEDDLCSEDYILLTISNSSNLNDVTFSANPNTGNIIVGDNGTLVRLSPDHKLIYPINPAGSANLNSVNFTHPFSKNTVIFAVGDAGTIIKTTDGGLTWVLLDFPNSADLESVDYDEATNRVVVGGSQYTIAQSTDGGETWTLIGIGAKQFSGGFMTFNDVYFYDDSLGFVGGPYGLMAKTTNAGEDWTIHVIDDFDEINSFYFTSPDSGIVVGRPGIARFTTDGGINWFEDPYVTSFLNGQTISSIIPITEHIGYIIGEGNFTLAVADDSTLLTPVETEDSSLPKYELSQNYPNPFNPSTKINYSVPQYETVTIKVYDLLGKEIATLLNEEKNAGMYQVEFKGEGITSGIYFYKLTVGNYSETKKLVLLK